MSVTKDSTRNEYILTTDIDQLNENINNEYINENIIENILHTGITIIFKKYIISEIGECDIYLLLNNILRNIIIKRFETKIEEISKKTDI